MSKSKTALIVGASVITIGAAGSTAVGVSAMNGDSQRHSMKGHSSWGWWWNNDRQDTFDAELATTLSAKYNLNTDEVAKVVETVRDNQFNILNDERQATLDEALSDEKITQEQYDGIVSRLNAIDDTYDTLDDVDGSERKEAWRDIMNGFKDLKKYLKEEDISVDLDLSFNYKAHYGGDRKR